MLTAATWGLTARLLVASESPDSRFRSTIVMRSLEFLE